MRICCSCSSTISIHAPTRGATIPLYSQSLPPAVFQSTLPRGERQLHRHSDILSPFISIHAPTRGATPRRMFGGKSSNISIHAPTRGATLYYNDNVGIHKISIHAPTRGATVDNYGRCYHYARFQSTLPRGERLYKDRTTAQFFLFQSTLPRGERH